MVTAYVLVLCVMGAEFIMLKELLKIPEVVEAKATFGMYDIVCKIETSSLNSLKDIIINDIRRVQLVQETQTLPLL